MKTLKQIKTIAAIVFTGNMFAQSTGEIKGTISDENGKGLPFVTVALMEDSTIINGISADEAGNFRFKQITPGIYNVQFSFVGYETKKINNVEVGVNKITYLYKLMSIKNSDTLTTIVVSEDWDPPMIDATYSTITKIDINQIENAPVPKNSVVALITNFTPGVMSTPDGDDIYIRGSRRGTAAYYIDGNRIVGTPDVVGVSIGSIEVLTGGMPAEYGDCTGGVVIISTKDYKWEMRRKKIARAAREEKEQMKKEQNN